MLWDAVESPSREEHDKIDKKSVSRSKNVFNIPIEMEMKIIYSTNNGYKNV